MSQGPLRGPAPLCWPRGRTLGFRVSLSDQGDWGSVEPVQAGHTKESGTTFGRPRPALSLHSLIRDRTMTTGPPHRVERGQGLKVWGCLRRVWGARCAPSPEVPALLPGRAAPGSPQTQVRCNCRWVGSLCRRQEPTPGLCYQMVPHLAGEGLEPWDGNCHRRQEAAP